MPDWRGAYSGRIPTSARPSLAFRAANTNSRVMPRIAAGVNGVEFSFAAHRTENFATASTEIGEEIQKMEKKFALRVSPAGSVPGSHFTRPCWPRRPLAGPAPYCRPGRQPLWAACPGPSGAGSSMSVLSGLAAGSIGFGCTSTVGRHAFVDNGFAVRSRGRTRQ